MLFGGVVDDQIDQNAHSTLRRTMCEFDKIAERAIAWVHVVVIRDVVAPVTIGRSLERHEPDRRYTQAMQIIEPPREALEISYAVAVRVHEGRDRQAVDNRVFVPQVVDHARPPAGRKEERIAMSKPLW